MSENLENNENLVELQGEDGSITKCEVFDVIEFEGKEYALLLPVGECDCDENCDDDCECSCHDSEYIVLEYIEEGEEAYFQNIDDEAEFDRVCEYIQSLEFDDEDVEVIE